MKMLHMAAFTLTVLVALNAGLTAVLNLNVVDMVFGSMGLSTIVYALAGVSALYLAINHKADCKTCA